VKRLWYRTLVRVSVVLTATLEFGHSGSDRIMTKARRISTRLVLAAMFIAAAGFTTSGSAVTPHEVLQDSALEVRARAISQNLRCVVCRNQSIDDSDAPLAHDLRVLLRGRLASGDTDEQAIEFIVARYGNFVLLNPPIQLNTLPLWAGPALFLLIAAIGFILHLRRRSTDQATLTASLTTAERQRIDELLDERRSI
jgi:cytochrome c-type biogenesis protein CcmH